MSTKITVNASMTLQLPEESVGFSASDITVDGNWIKTTIELVQNTQQNINSTMTGWSALVGPRYVLGRYRGTADLAEIAYAGNTVIAQMRPSDMALIPLGDTWTNLLVKQVNATENGFLDIFLVG